MRGSNFLVRSRTALAACVLLCVPAGTTQSAEDPVKAHQLVHQALAAELAGDNTQRQDLLRQAQQHDSQLAAARWHQGRVRIADQWLSLADAQQQLASDRRVADYTRLRNSLPDGLASHVTLAQYCDKFKLSDRARLHWGYVLTQQPKNTIARERLNLREYRGLLLTPEGIEQYREFVKQAEKINQEWLPKAKRWRDDIAGQDDARRDAALIELRKVDSATVIPILESVLSEESELLGREVVTLLDKLQDHAATVSLARHAVLSSFPEVRLLAAQKLKRRPWHRFVPGLLANMQTPLELSYYLNAYRGDGVQFALSISQEGLAADYVVGARGSVTHGPSFTPLSDANRGPVTENDYQAARTSANAVMIRRATLTYARWQETVQRLNRQSGALNERIHEALAVATGAVVEPSPKSWWQWWVDYNELALDENHPVYRSFANYDRRVILQGAVTGPYVPSNPHFRVVPAALAIYAPDTFRGEYRRSCFLRGTPVWTDSGPLAIERIRVGDRVLSQHPETGELAYKVVVQTTVRPPARSLWIRVGQDHIPSTLGHAFWVPGDGWTMAKHLQTGQRLHAVHGAHPIDQIEPGPTAEAYNLVVGDFGTYFVGQQKLLVHDNTPWSTVEQPLPGLASSR